MAGKSTPEVSLKLLTASLEFFTSLGECESYVRSGQGSHTQLG